MNRLVPTRDTLAAQQQALLAALLGQPQQVQGLLDDAQTGRGLLAYRSNGHALAERTLSAAYPVVAALLGGHAFDQLARALWHRHPPQRGDLAQWGGALPDFVASADDLKDLPYLHDVALLEWRLHEAAGAADAGLDAASFERLTREDPDGLGLRLAPGTTVLHSDYPVASIVLAHGADGPDFDTVGQRLRDGTAETALVWRDGLKPRLGTVTTAEATLLEHLLDGRSLPAALTAATNSQAQPLDLSSWLTQAVQSGLVLGVCDHPLNPSTHNPHTERDAT